jgi:hypothetical protein
MARRIKKALISHISLVPRGANRLPVIYKEDGAFDLDLLTKAAADFDDKGELLAVVYAPEIRDSQGDVASREVIREAMHTFAKNGEGIDIRHNERALSKDDAFVAESFEIQAGDPRFTDFKSYDGKPVNVTGGWGVLVKIDNADLRKQYREGKSAGVSMGGKALVEKENTDDDTGLLRKVFKALGLTQEPSQETPEMTEADLKKALAENNDALAAKIAEAVKPKAVETPAVETPAVVAKDETPIFKGEPTVANLKRHRVAVLKAKLVKGLDFESDEQMDEALAKLEELEAELAELPADEPKVLRKSAARSNQPAKVAKEGAFLGFEDDTEDLAKIGKEMADAVNSRMGYPSAVAAQ